MKTAFTRCEDISKERFYHWTTTATATRTSKRTIGLLSKTTTLYVHHTFLYISLPSLHDYDVKCLISRFMEDVNKRWLIFLSLSKRKCGPEKINSRVRNSPTLFWHFQRIGLNATVFEKREFILKVTFSLQLPSTMPKLPKSWVNMVLLSLFVVGRQRINGVNINLENKD